MEESWDNWPLHPEIGCDDEDEFLREILLQPSPQPPTPAPFSSESESDHSFHAVSATDGVVLSPIGNNLVKSNSSNSIVSTQTGTKRHRRSSSPKTYILSFDNSTMIPATPEPCVNYGQYLGTESKRFSHSSSLPSNKRHMESQNGAEAEKRGNNNNNGAKKGRNSSQTMDHIMAERKRRQELTERFIALSATIPGLSKTDKASVLRAAIDYVKQLRERVEELEKQDKKGANTVAASVIVIKKPDLRGINNNHNNNEDSTTTTSTETSSDNDCGGTLPEIEARALGKEVLIEIHCEKEKSIELKLLTHLENLQLCVTGSSVLPFGNSALSITIIAQMGEGYKMTVSDLLKSLRQVLLKSHVACDSDPY